MSDTSRRLAVAAALVALVGAARVVASVDRAPGPPGPLTPGIDRFHALLLEPAQLLEGPDIAAQEKGRIKSGEVVLYYGETTDAFGRTWSIVGDPHAWVRQESWYAIPAGAEEVLAQTGKISLLSGLPPPPLVRNELPQDEQAAQAILAALRAPLEVAADWWQRSIEIDAAYLPEPGELLGIGVVRVPPAVAQEAVDLVGGREALGPWPETPGFGRLHVSPLLPLVFRYAASGWELGEAPVSLGPTLSLVGNPDLRIDTSRPNESTGVTLQCWRLLGALDPRNMPVGRLGEAPPAPARGSTKARRDSNVFLGLRDLTNSLTPVAAATMLAPRPLRPKTSPRGVVLEDNTLRQAVYLEQVLAPGITAALRGRRVRLQVLARAAPQAEGSASATLGIEIQAGTLRQATSAQVGALPSTLQLEVTIPEDAPTIVIRLLPLDRSIAVQESGNGVFERVELTPAEWPRRLEATTLLLRRVRVVTYSPVRRFTRAPLAVSERDGQQLQATWKELVAGDWTLQQRRSLLAGELSAAMSPQEVRLAWGDPDSRYLSADGLRRWDYADRSAAFGVQEGLLAWTRESRPATSELTPCAGGIAPAVGESRP